MHPNNRQWLEDLRRQYPRSFVRPTSVLELGARNINGSAREYFDVDRYIGVDLVEGVDVDVVGAAGDIWFPEEFDVLVSLSMLEHDLDWQRSIRNGMKHLRPGGLFFLSFGAEGNAPHEESTMPFDPKVASEVVAVVQEQGDVLEAFSEGDRYGYGSDCGGYYDMVIEKRSRDL